MRHLVLLVIMIWFLGCKTQQFNAVSYEVEDLKIEQLTKNTFVHISYLQTEQFGKVPCNGMIVKSGKEAIVFDTPIDDSTSLKLIQWIETELKCRIKAVVVTHFHIDCLGGLKAFHDRGIPSYANKLTIELAKPDNETLPQNGFDQTLELEVGDKKVINAFMGEGHTRDNVVSYFLDEKVLFGGCLIKSLKSGKGNLADANTAEWSNTVKTIKRQFKDVEMVIPGHGKPGGIELLDYTIEMFKE